MIVELCIFIVLAACIVWGLWRRKQTSDPTRNGVFLYVVFGLGLSFVVYVAMLAFERDLMGQIGSLTMIPVAIYALISKQDNGRINIWRLLLLAIFIHFTATIAAVFVPYLVITIIISFTLIGLFLLIYRLIDDQQNGQGRK